MLKNKTWRFYMGAGIGTALGMIFAVALCLVPELRAWRAPGPMNSGHTALACNECHQSVAGSLRQKIQANVKTLLAGGNRFIPLGFQKVDNGPCRDCHRNSKDTHPVYRFLEPRFFKARSQLQVHYCSACHREHSGRRVTADLPVCAACHDNIDVKNDPLDTSHKALAQQKRWNTCLGCHDFHGNHRRRPPLHMHEVIADNKLRAYFAGAKSPYGKPQYTAKSTRYANP